METLPLVSLLALVLTACGGGAIGNSRVPSSASNIVANARAPFAPAGRGFAIDPINGSDINPGTVDQPWKTLSKLTSVTLTTGQGIYLRCGGVWRESLTLASGQLVDGVIIRATGMRGSKSRNHGRYDFPAHDQERQLGSRGLPGTPKINACSPAQRCGSQVVLPRPNTFGRPSPASQSAWL
jgi:hypothetical protein